MPASPWMSACLSAGGDAVNYQPPGVHLCCLYMCVCQNRRSDNLGLRIRTAVLSSWRGTGWCALSQTWNRGRWLILATFLSLFYPTGSPFTTSDGNECLNWLYSHFTINVKYNWRFLFTHFWFNLFFVFDLFCDSQWFFCKLLIF